MRYKQEYFYSLKQVIDYYYTEGNTPFSADDEFALDRVLTDFTGGIPQHEITGIQENEFEASSSAPTHYGLIHKLFMYIINKYQDEAIGFGEIENPTLIQLEANPTCRKFFRVMVGLMVETYPKYSTMLKLYQDEKDHLMDDVKNYVKFDDTPQTPGSYGTDEFMTTYTEYSNEFSTKMARIKEIENNFANLMKEWCDEFANLFIEV